MTANYFCQTFKVVPMSGGGGKKNQGGAWGIETYPDNIISSVLWGVLQGSILEPFLFVLLINDLPCSLSPSGNVEIVELYVDDTNI